MIFMYMCIYTYTLDVLIIFAYYYDKGKYLHILRDVMKTVNALKIRNHLGEVLEELHKTGKPILVSKGRKIQAVLITPEQFQRRFLDYQAEENKKKLIEDIRSMKAKSKGNKNSLDVLRKLRGYEL